MRTHLGWLLRASAIAAITAGALASTGCSADATTTSPTGAPASSDGSSSKTGSSAPGAKAGESSQATIDLGQVTPGQELTFDVPADALGFNVTVTGNAEWHVGIDALTSPSGAEVVRGYFPHDGPSALALGSRGLGSISVPQSDDTATKPLEVGAWKLVAGGVIVDPTQPVDKGAKSVPPGTAVTGTLQVVISIQRSGDGQFHGGALDMHVYIPTGLRVHDPDPVHAIDAEQAKTDASLEKRIGVFYAELERLFGIERGQVSFHPIDASFLVAETGDTRAALMAQANVAAPQALHVVLTNRLAYSDGDGLLGYSVGLPGAPNTVSTVRSSIAVALYDEEPASNDAVTILHEMGHFVGLMHTTEEDGTTDLLADTPACSLYTGASAGGKGSGGKGKPSTCEDVDNLMTPAGPLHQTLVSPSQVRVVRGSPIYRARRP